LFRAVYLIFLKIILQIYLSQNLFNYFFRHFDKLLAKSDENLCIQIANNKYKFNYKSQNAKHQPVTLHIYNPIDFCFRIILDPKIGLGESFMKQDWDAEPSPKDLLTLMIRAKSKNNVAKLLAITSSFLNQKTNEHKKSLIVEKIVFWIFQAILNTVEGSATNIHQHYDLGNDMFQKFLDPTMTYSCAIFEQRITELLIYAKVSSNITEDVTNHFKYTLNSLKLEEGVYDKVIAIEMIEAVGHEFLPQFFNVISDRLKPDGIAFLQAIVCPDAYYERYRKSSDFIKKYIFPGGHMPSLNGIEKALPEKILKITEIEQINRNYAVTLDFWNLAWMEHEQEILKMGYPLEFHRKWQFYFALCSSLFEYDHIGTVHIKLQKCI
uniref:Cyclopropane-fatty-acyl-phospholipid synthase n=1 Tax=Syphacia muris TaxID=451379 RepID=A0A0N5AEU6_9BILA